MTLQNAFKDLATEQAVTNLTTAIDALASLLQRQASTQPTRALQYARTATDAMRVNIDNQPSFNMFAGNNGSGSPAGAQVQYPLWGNNTFNLVDVRYQYGEAQVTNFQMSRNRWVFS